MITIWVIYFAVGLVATIFGALAGLGGGVIIKPVLDLLGDYDVGTISILSAATVFSMTVVSLINSRHTDENINIKQSFTLAIGSIIGGIVGKALFNYIVRLINLSDLVTVIQAVMLAGLMVLIYIFVKHKDRMKTYKVKNTIVIFSIGFILGIVAAFLGIGGGPFNVAILALLFSMSAKESALNSIFIIFFSQLSALLLTAFTTGFADYDLSMLWFMIAGGVSGSYIGSKIFSKVTDTLVINIFTFGIIVIILINIFNIVRYFVG